MTTTDLAAALLRDVPRYDQYGIRLSGRENTPNDETSLVLSDVLDALTAALDGVDERAGELARSDDPKVMLYHGEYVEALRALLAQIAVLRAERDDAVIKRAAWELEAKTQQARLTAAEAEVEKLTGALQIARVHVANNAEGWSVSRGAARDDLTIVDAALTTEERK